MDLVIALIISLVATATPLVFASTGELITERSGVLNLGVEGMMAVGAVSAFVATVIFENTFFGVIAGGLGGMLVATLFASLVLWLRTDQVPTGLALTLFGLGISALLGYGYVGVALEHQPRGIPVLENIPILGKIIFGYDVLVYFSLVLATFSWWVMTKTRLGLIIRAVGENHDAAHALGYKVILTRFLCVMYGGFCAGLGGAYLSVFHTPLWAENMTAGRGWIALALVVFASWKIWRCVLGAYLFAGLSVLALFQQGKWFDIQSQYLSMAPYVITILVLAWVSKTSKAKMTAVAPGSLTQEFGIKQ